MLLFHLFQLCFRKATFSAGAPLSVPGASWVGSQGGFGGLGCSLGESWEVRILLFRWLQIVFCDVMLFDVFSQDLGAMSFSRKRRSVKWLCCFWEVNMLLFQWFQVCFSKDTFSAGAFLMNSVQDFNGKSYAVVGPKSSKQWKSFCQSDISRFLCFSECSEFREM